VCVHMYIYTQICMYIYLYIYVCQHTGAKVEDTMQAYLSPVGPNWSSNRADSRSYELNRYSRFPVAQSQTVYNTKGTRAHTHRELIRKWLWEP